MVLSYESGCFLRVKMTIIYVSFARYTFVIIAYQLHIYRRLSLFLYRSTTKLANRRTIVGRDYGAIQAEND